MIVGQQRVFEELMISMLAGGHCLLLGVPGLAKTLMVRTLAETLNLSFNRIQFTPDLMPADITGSDVLEEDRTTGKRVFRMAPLHHHFELRGWPESKVVVRFWIIAVLLALLSLSTLKLQ